MDDKCTIWDPLRRKSVPLTPEEEVRQWFIDTLHRTLGVPLSLMGSEVSLRRGRKSYRADIVVYGRDASPIAVVECKRPEVTLDQEVMSQALRYDMILGVKYLFVTNGAHTRVARRTQDGNIEFPDRVPDYNEMLQG